MTVSPVFGGAPETVSVNVAVPPADAEIPGGETERLIVGRVTAGVGVGVAVGVGVGVGLGVGVGVGLGVGVGVGLGVGVGFPSGAP